MKTIKLKDGKEYLLIINNRVLKELYKTKKVDVIEGSEMEFFEDPEVIGFVAHRGFTEGAKFNETTFPYSEQKTGVLLGMGAAAEVTKALLGELVEAANYAKDKLGNNEETGEKKN